MIDAHDEQVKYVLQPNFGIVPSLTDCGIKQVNTDDDEFLVLKGAWLQLSHKKIANVYANGSTIYAKFKNAGGTPQHVVKQDIPVVKRSVSPSKEKALSIVELMQASSQKVSELKKTTSPLKQKALVQREPKNGTKLMNQRVSKIPLPTNRIFVDEFKELAIPAAE
jgi:hypothetical protein